MNGAIQGQLEGLLEIAEERGAKIQEEIKKGIESGNIDPEKPHFRELMSSLSDLSGQMENKADEAGGAFAQKMTEKEPEAKSAGENLSCCCIRRRIRKTRFSVAGRNVLIDHTSGYRERD